MIRIGVKNNEGLIKYRAKLRISVDGKVNEADIIGALFGQTEGLFEDNFDFKTLQQHGRIGRISINLKNEGDRGVKGTIELPCDLKKVEISILVATLESIDRVGPCQATIEFYELVDVRQEKRKSIEERAIAIMKKMGTTPHFKTVERRVLKKSNVARLIEYGTEKLAAGSGIFDNEGIVLVEGKADVKLLLQYGISNAIELRGHTKASLPTIKKLCKSKTVTAFLDGDRGGDLLLKALATNLSIDYVARAPMKREVEHLTETEINQALSNRVKLGDASFFTEAGTIESLSSTFQKKQRSKTKATTAAEYKEISKQKMKSEKIERQKTETRPIVKSRYKASVEMKKQKEKQAVNDKKLKAESSKKPVAIKSQKVKNQRNTQQKEKQAVNDKKLKAESSKKPVAIKSQKVKNQRNTQQKEEVDGTQNSSSRYVKGKVYASKEDKSMDRRGKRGGERREFSKVNEGRRKSGERREFSKVNEGRRKSGERREFSKVNEGRRKFGERKSGSKRIVKIPDALLSQIKKIRQTFKAVFFDNEYNQISSVPASEAYSYLENNEAVSVVIDGVVTKRMVELASKRKMQYIIGAVLGEQNFHQNFKKVVIASYPRQRISY